MTLGANTAIKPLWIETPLL